MKSQGGYPNGDFRIASENTSLQLDLDHASERRELNKEAVRIFPLSFDSLFLFFNLIFISKKGGCVWNVFISMKCQTGKCQLVLSGNARQGIESSNHLNLQL